MLGMVSNLHLLFLAPNGRFVPRWTWRQAAGFTGAMVALAVYALGTTHRVGLLASMGFFFVAVLLWLVLIGVGIACQVYRYRRVSSPVERQQIKWVATGLAGVTVGILINAALLATVGALSGPARLWSNLARVTLVNVSLLAWPICLAFSILRYRLWDIDVLLRRTLIYSALTSILALAYFASVVALQSAFRLVTGEAQSTLVVVLSTLAIAALFGPLRRRVQAAIDRRFFRQKYDAAHTLTNFAAALRDETDLQHLSEQLENVVQETMQPAQVSLWLRRRT
jgi:hypothetical protein